MITLVLALTLVAAPQLKPAAVGDLKAGIPAGWERQDQKDGARFDAPEKDAWIELSVYKVDPARGADECLAQLLEALGTEGWKRLKIGGAPAARQVQTESGSASEEGEETHVDVQSTMVIGCNGRLKWVMTFAANKKQKAKYDAVAARVLASVKYPK